MPGQDDERRQYHALRRATALATEAMDLLDAHQSSPEAAAHMELALQKLREALKRNGSG